MGFWERLVGSEQPQHKDQRLLLPELVTNYQAERQLAKQLQVHAELSPHQAGADQLRAAAEEQTVSPHSFKTRLLNSEVSVRKVRRLRKKVRTTGPGWSTI